MRATSASSSGGTRGANARSGGAVSARMRAATCSTVSPTNGARPVTQ
jgi:hypothetical protein